MQWQLDCEAGFARLRVYGDHAAVAGHHAPDDVQAEAGSLADLLGRKERVEDVVLHFGRYPGTVVDDLYRHPFSPSERPNPDPPLAAQGVSRIVDKVGPH